ncbi:MAG: hypothetical protein JRF06_02815 [Deltaproteobacteria bacterium]|nr:hypothetical protein [Deltaproteobacteria bacterium]MBW2334026.1 hypothetical protein [Deltaproteobacteria bacterium]
MKCPKCRYISFDYNEVCPKCNKDLASERKKINLPDYKPNPPFFLGSLTGDLGDSGFGIKVGAITGKEDVEMKDLEMHLDIETSQEGTEKPQPREAPELDSQESVTDIGLEEPSGLQFELEDKETLMKQEEEPDEGDISLDLGDLSLDEETSPAKAAQKETPYSTSELVTSEIDKKKLGVTKNPEDSELELDLEEFEDESS